MVKQIVWWREQAGGPVWVGVREGLDVVGEGGPRWSWGMQQTQWPGWLGSDQCLSEHNTTSRATETTSVLLRTTCCCLPRCLPMGRSGPKRLGSGRCGVALTTPSLQAGLRYCSSPPSWGGVSPHSSGQGRCRVLPHPAGAAFARHKFRAPTLGRAQGLGTVLLLVLRGRRRAPAEPSQLRTVSGAPPRPAVLGRPQGGLRHPRCSQKVLPLGLPRPWLLRRQPLRRQSSSASALTVQARGLVRPPLQLPMQVSAT